MSSDYLVYLGLGSNQDTPQRQLTMASRHLKRLPGTHVIKTAPRYLTKAWGVTDQADFLNTVILISTRLKPLALLKKIKHIEYRLMGRTVNKRWHSRCIDIDILYYAQKPFNRPQLQLPHPFMPQRCFVLRPLLDLNPVHLPLAVKKALTLRKTCCLPLKHQNNRLENNTTSKITTEIR